VIGRVTFSDHANLVFINVTAALRILIARGGG
jgi:hypothetical protein